MQPMYQRAGPDPWHERLKPSPARGKLSKADRHRVEGSPSGADESRRIRPPLEIENRTVDVPRAADRIEGRGQIHSRTARSQHCHGRGNKRLLIGPKVGAGREPSFLSSSDVDGAGSETTRSPHSGSGPAATAIQCHTAMPAMSPAVRSHDKAAISVSTIALILALYLVLCRAAQELDKKNGYSPMAALRQALPCAPDRPSRLTATSASSPSPTSRRNTPARSFPPPDRLDAR